MPMDTKAMIADAFIQLAHQKRIEKITVKDIVEHCNISRQAFYYHFQDIFDVIEWIIHHNMRKAFEEGLLNNDPRDAILHLVLNVIENRGKLQQLISSQHGAQIEDMIIQTICTQLREVHLRKYPRVTLPTANPDTSLHFLIYGVAGVIKEAIKSNQCDPEFLCDELYALTNKAFGA